MHTRLFEPNTVSPAKLEPSEYHVRGETMIPDSFVRSVERVGIIQPPLVRPEGEHGDLRVIDGVRRVRAAKDAGVNEIDVIVLDVDDAHALSMSLTANMDAWSKQVSDSDREKAIMSLAIGERRETNQWETAYDEAKRVEYELGVRGDIDVFRDSLGHVTNVGEKTLSNLVDEFDTVRDVAEASDEQLGSVPGIGEKTIPRVKEAAQTVVDTDDGVEIVWECD